LLLSCTLAGAQPVRLPRAKTPLLLAGFEDPASVAKWTGLKCEQTAAHASEGRFGMKFTLPAWQEGANEWPAVYLVWDGGRGYPTKDWSHYAKIAFDAWVDGDAPADLALELRDKQGSNGYTSHQTLQPGRMNHTEIPLADLSGSVDVANIEEIVFFATRPKRDYTITVDNLVLLPGEKPPLATFDLVYPNYRGLIFPDARRVEVSVTTQSAEYDLMPRQLTATIALEAAGKSVSVKRALRTDRERLSIPVAGLPPGPARVSVALRTSLDAAPVAERRYDLRKITAEEVRGLRVYIDGHNNAVVDGKPFFPLGWYDSPDYDHMGEIADSPFNCILDYGADNKPKAWMLKYLDAMQKKGLKLIYCLNDVYPTATYLEKSGWEGIKGNQAIADAVMKAYRNHPAVLAWYLNDELPRALAPQLVDYYARAKASDPTRPCYIVLCNMSELKYFPDTTDVMGVDPYPMPSGPVTLVRDWMDAANEAVGGHKPTWLVPQAFAWYQYNPEGSNRGRTPTASELQTGRAPTYDEERCMTYLALTHGAKGLIYYCYYDLRVLPQYKEMWGWMKTIAAEVRTLSPVLLSPEDMGTVAVTGGNIDTRLKKADGRLYLLAVNPDKTPCQATFDLRRALPAEVNVMFETRKAATQGNTLTDSFKPLEVHVYDLGAAGSRTR
jgi:hypothetical protein